MPISMIETTSDAFKTDYLPTIRDQVNNKSGVFLSMLDKKTVQTTGKGFEFVIKYGRNGGIISGDENALLPESRGRQYKRATGITKNMFGRVMMTEKSILASKSNKGAYINMVESMLEDLTNDAKENFYRQSFQDGKGILCTTNANSSTNTLVVDTVKFLAEGQFIDIVSDAGAVKVAKREVLQRDEATNTIIISGDAVTTLATDVISIADSYGKEMTGLKAIFDNGNTLYGIDRSTNKWFNANVVDHAGAEINEIVMRKMVQKALNESGSKINYIQCGNGVANAYYNLQLSYKRNIEYMDLKGGFKTMSFNGIPLSEDYYEEDGVMRFLNTENFAIRRLGDWDFLNRGGKVLFPVNDRPSYQAVLFMFAEMTCDKPKGQSTLKNIKEY